MRDKLITSLEIFTSSDLSLSPLGNALPTVAQMKTAYLTLYGADPENPNAYGEWIKLMPMWTMHELSNGTDPFMFAKMELIPRNIIWDKSFITLSTPLANTTNISFIFNVGYQGLGGNN